MKLKNSRRKTRLQKGDVYFEAIQYLNTIFLFMIISVLSSCNSSNKPGSDNPRAINKSNSVSQKDYLFEEGKFFDQCHASTLIRLQTGEFLVAWFAGTKEGNDDVGIWMTRGRFGHWDKPVEIAKIDSVAHWNPVLFQAPDGSIFLFFKVGEKISFWETWVKYSVDDGRTWSDAEELISEDRGGRGPVRNKPIMISDGTLIAGASNENGSWNVFFDLSRDIGKTWKATPYIEINRKDFKGKGIIQPTLWESSPGNIHALLRSTDGFIYRTDSRDFGKTWSLAYRTALPNPNSAIDLVKVPDGSLILACNSDNVNWGSRSELVLMKSTDNGETWKKMATIEHHEGSEESSQEKNEEKKHEYSYPAIISYGDSIVLTYTWNRKRIAIWRGSSL